MVGYNAPATAGILKIETQTGVTVAGDLLKVRVTATNKGTGPAHNVQVHLILLSERWHGPVKGQLGPGQTDTVLFKKTLSGIKKGRYPLTVLVDFHDANQYPFSAVSCTTFHFREDANPDLLCLGSDITVETHGELRFSVKNLGFRPRKVRATLVLPKELSTPRPQIDLQIDPRSERAVVFEITNFSPLSGARYYRKQVCTYQCPDLFNNNHNPMSTSHTVKLWKTLTKVAKKCLKAQNLPSQTKVQVGKIEENLAS